MYSSSMAILNQPELGGLRSPLSHPCFVVIGPLVTNSFGLIPKGDPLRTLGGVPPPPPPKATYPSKLANPANS